MNKIFNELFGSSLSDIEDSPRKIHKVKSVIVKVQKDGNNNNVIKPGSDKLTKGLSTRPSSTKTREVERKSQNKRKPEEELKKESSKKTKVDDKSSNRTIETKHSDKSEKVLHKLEKSDKETKVSEKPKKESKKTKTDETSESTPKETEIRQKVIESPKSEPIKPTVEVKESKTISKVEELETIKVETKASKVESYKRPAGQPSGKLLNFMKMYESMKTAEVEFSDSEEEVDEEETAVPTPEVKTEISVKRTEEVIKKSNESSRMIAPVQQRLEKENLKTTEVKTQVFSPKVKESVFPVHQKQLEMITKTKEIVTELKIQESIPKVEKSINVNFPAPQRLEQARQATQPAQRLFSLPRRIQNDSNDDKSQNERVMRLYENFKESTEGIRLYENAIQQPQQAVIPRAEYAVKVEEPIRQPKRKWEFPIDIPQPTLTTTKPENFRFNRQNPKAFTAVKTTKPNEEFKVPEVPKVEPAKPLSTFQRRMMNKNAIKSSIQKCNQVQVKNQSETEQAAKRFKSLEAEKLWKEIDEFFKIPELLQPIYDVPCKVMEFYNLPELVQPIIEVPEKIADYYSVPKVLEPIQELPKKKRGRPAKGMSKINEPIQELPKKKRGRPAKGNMRNMVNNYAANAENLVRGTGL